MSKLSVIFFLGQQISPNSARDLIGHKNSTLTRLAELDNHICSRNISRCMVLTTSMIFFRFTGPKRDGVEMGGASLLKLLIEELCVLKV